MLVLMEVTELVGEGPSRLIHDVLTERNLAADKEKLVTRFMGHCWSDPADRIARSLSTLFISTKKAGIISTLNATEKISKQRGCSTFTLYHHIGLRKLLRKEAE
jgi:hypothetical protein